MKLKTVTEEQLETMSYDDIAYVILKERGKKMSLSDLFNAVCEVMKLDEKAKDDYIAKFFTLLSTEKRFIKLDKGFWDLRENHTSKIELNELEEDEETDSEDSNEEETEEDDSMYIDETKDIDDDETEDEYKDLVLIDDEGEADL